MRKFIILGGIIFTSMALCCLFAMAQPDNTSWYGQIQDTLATAVVPSNDDSGLVSYPDLPLPKIPNSVVSTRYLVQHRSALNGKKIKVSGFVAEAVLGEKACPTQAGGCAQPRIFIAENLSHEYDLNYRIMVLVQEEKENYSVGQWVEIEGIVHASKAAVYVEKP